MGTNQLPAGRENADIVICDCSVFGDYPIVTAAEQKLLAEENNLPLVFTPDRHHPLCRLTAEMLGAAQFNVKLGVKLPFVMFGICVCSAVGRLVSLEVTDELLQRVAKWRYYEDAPYVDLRLHAAPSADGYFNLVLPAHREAFLRSLAAMRMYLEEHRHHA
eukprot:TRINITY_DN5782_c0_g1_i1.p1 TRINITY_DN5782_c0_g1~~TRINITY_DN5782_c0_g1_i1.p1  ORF type:complete len:161 (+),score=45.55 TRINITY_DN5782_c0_g1_i1:184-666(+)